MYAYRFRLKLSAPSLLWKQIGLLRLITQNHLEMINWWWWLNARLPKWMYELSDFTVYYTTQYIMFGAYYFRCKCNIWELKHFMCESKRFVKKVGRHQPILATKRAHTPNQCVEFPKLNNRLIAPTDLPLESVSPLWFKVLFPVWKFCRRLSYSE